MQIYIDFNSKIFNKCLEQITLYCKDTAQNGRFKINITEDIKLSKITDAIEKTKTYSKIRYYIPIEYVDVSYIKKTCNCKIIVNFQININHELTKNDLKKLEKLSKLNRVFEVYDTSGIDQSEEFIKYRNLCYINNLTKKDEVKFFYIACDNRQDTCMYASCLGRTLYVDKDGNYSFCPKHSELTKFSDISKGVNNDYLYNSKSFLDTLSSAVKMRKNCYQTCEYIELCQGACPLDENSCERFKKNYSLALNKKSDIFNKMKVLNYEPLYVEENILWCVSRGKK